MNTINALINAAAVWFVLKAVEVVPFAIYDLFSFVNDFFSKREDDLHNRPKLSDRFDKSRGKFEFIFSGAGFLQFSLYQSRKRLFFISSLVPVLIFVLEIFSIFLGGETRVCQTSRDPSVVRAPALQIFGEGERELNVLDLHREMIANGRTFRPCLQRQSTYSGVEYLMTVCSELATATVGLSIADTHFPENERISIAVSKSGSTETELILLVLSLPFKDSLRNYSMVGVLLINCEVLVNGKGVLAQDATKDYVINETVKEQIHNDVKILEKARNLTRSEFIENERFFLFMWAGPRDFFAGARNVLYAIMSQSRRVGLKTAKEMSESNVGLLLPEVDIMCEEDFFLPRTAAIIIIGTGAVLRLLLITLPTSLSSAQYTLLLSEKREEFGTSTELVEQRPGQLEYAL